MCILHSQHRRENKTIFNITTEKKETTTTTTKSEIKFVHIFRLKAKGVRNNKNNIATIISNIFKSTLPKRKGGGGEKKRKKKRKLYISFYN